MYTWDIAKLLIESCSSPEEVEQVIGTLNDREAVEQVCAFMAPFASYEPSISYHIAIAEPPVVQESDGHGSSSEVDKTVTGKSGDSAAGLSREMSVDQLQTLFRTNGMTNKQVEQWMGDNFGVEVIVGKDALWKYLTKVLAAADSDLTDRIMIAAERLMDDDNPSSGDRKAAPPSTQRADGYGSPVKVVGKIDSEKSRGEARLSSMEASASQLEALFRTIGMTNKQVEQWITDNFGVQVIVGKHSLRKYLIRVLDVADLGLTNRLLSGAQRLSMNSGSLTSEIREYWDQLDKHFAVVE